MKIIIMERDVEEMRGIEWYIKHYLSYDIDVMNLCEPEALADAIASFLPDLLLLELELIQPPVEKMLRQLSIPIIALTGEPLFQQALKAVNIRACNLFVKPIPLDELKSSILSLPVKAASPPEEKTLRRQLYADLFLNSSALYTPSEQTFFVMECADIQENLPFYNWLIALPIFNEFVALPLQKRILCLTQTSDTAPLIKQLRLFVQEWTQSGGGDVNIALYDGEPSTLTVMYNACKKSLMRRFYTGYPHIFKTSETLHITRLDPLLTFEEQQLWIDSLDQGDVHKIKNLLYRLTNTSMPYHQEDVRIHLTSILAQIRRYMKKYHLQQHAAIETQYRELFHYILEHPVLYTIIQEFILFTQRITNYVKREQQAAVADYTELAVAFIEKNYADADLTLQTTAAALNISPNYLSTMFSKKRGIPFKKFVQQYRLQLAANDLIQSTQSIASIAEAVGFVDNNYFSKVFRSHYQLTPYRYRLHHKKSHVPHSTDAAPNNAHEALLQFGHTT